MAFLCPSRVGRKTRVKTPRKKDKPFVGLPGRITGSDSIDTLQRVGLEKETGLSPKSKVRVINDFQPCVDEEVAVNRGDEVYLLYKENDWAYVIKRNGEEGFIPYSYCTRLFGSEPTSPEFSTRKNKSPGFVERDSFFNDGWSSECPRQDSNPPTQRGLITREEMIRILQPPPPISEDDKPEVRPFRKTSHGQFIVLFDFSALDENDTNVERAELVDVLNIEDPDWSWIRHYDGREGFVPKSYICPVEPLKAIEKALNGGHSRQSSVTGRTSASSSISGLRLVPKNHQKMSNNLRMGHPYLSQPSLNLATNENKSLSESNGKLSRTYASSDAVNRQRDASNTSHGTLNHIMAYSESMSTLPTPTSHIVTLRAPDRAISQIITHNEQQNAGLSSTFKPKRKQSATDSDFDDPASASSLPGTPRFETSQHAQTDAMKNNQQDHRIESVPSPDTNTSPNIPTYATPKQSSNNMRVARAATDLNVHVYANVPFPPKQSDDQQREPIASDNVVECVLLYDYTARSQDDLTVKRGESVYDDGRNRGNAHWLWVFSPRAKAYGYVPRQYIKQVVQTSL